MARRRRVVRNDLRGVDVAGLRAALEEFAAVPVAPPAPGSRFELVADLLPQVETLRALGHKDEAIVEIFAAWGVPMSPATLADYLGRIQRGQSDDASAVTEG